MHFDFSNKKAFVILAALLLLLLLLSWPGNGLILQYLFYLRVPLIGGALLFLLPLICIYALPSMLGNMYVLSNPLRLGMVIPGAVAVALGQVLIFAVIGANADERFNLVPIACLDALAANNAILPYMLAILLALPSAWAAYWASGPDSQEMTDQQRRSGAFMGMVLSGLLLYAVYWLRSNTSVTLASDFLVSLISILPAAARAGYLIETASGGWVLTDGHLVMASYLLIVTALYFIGLFAYRPKGVKTGMQLPAISYVLGLLQIFSLILGLLTFLLDFYRIPVLLSMLAVSALAYRLWKVDHYYDLCKTNAKPPAADAIFQAVQQRLKDQAGDKTLVVVCASGGGIQAAGWTTMVLTGLQEATDAKFTQAIGLISAVSGGSVGTLHFLDRFNLQQRAPDTPQFDPIFQAATADSLGATGWGLVYPDLWRLIGLPFLSTEPRDRGAAINLDWRAHMRDPQKPPTLQDWVSPIMQGQLPIPVFNATVVEDGRQFLLSPMILDTPVEQGLEFNRLYPGCDIEASTAALLSATFPYVTPVTRNSRSPQNEPIVHVADGGFFDNFGVVTATDWLDRRVLEKDDQRSIKKVLWVEIRAFPNVKPKKTAKDKPVGWWMAIFGPIFAIVGARNSTQAQRNDDDVKDLQAKWQAQGVQIEAFKIAFPEHIEFFSMPTQTESGKINRYTTPLESEELKAKRYQPPLSWSLTRKQREAIRQAWYELVKNPKSEAAKLIQAWQNSQTIKAGKAGRKN